MNRLDFQLAAASLTMLLYMSQGSLHPLILIPGSGGNQLEARLTKEYKASSIFCGRWNPIFKQRDGWFRLWFDSSVLLSPFTKCFAERMTLYYDPDIDDYHNAPGVETRVPHFGSTESLVYLDPHLKHITSYMAQLVNSLEQIGYINGETLFGAPYDFRYGLAAEGHPSKVGSEYLQDLKSLIENASKTNDNKPVILLSHSLGGLFALQLLNRNTPSWRQQFIEHLVTLAPPWAGTVTEMLTFASGNTLGVPFVNPLLVRNEQRCSESNLWLMPSPTTFPLHKPLVITPNKTYTVQKLPEFLNDIGYPEGVYPYETRIKPLVEHLVAPKVAITCVVGQGVKTPETLLYGANGFDERPEIVYGDGDGTVNMVSLLAVEKLWADEEGQEIKVVKVSGTSHSSILKDDVAIRKIIEEICEINSLADVMRSVI